MIDFSALLSSFSDITLMFSLAGPPPYLTHLHGLSRAMASGSVGGTTLRNIHLISESSYKQLYHFHNVLGSS